MATTIKLQQETKSELESFREHRRESYEDIVRKLIFVAKTAKKEPHLSKKTILEIEAARKRMESGEHYTEAEARKLLGL